MDDAEISVLNTDYLGRSGPTNVIAFPMTEGPFGSLTPGLLGDVVISVETVHVQAVGGGFTLEELLDFYLIHGILHLIGYDHVTSEEDAALMDAKTNELWLMLGHQETE